MLTDQSIIIIMQNGLPVNVHFNMPGIKFSSVIKKNRTRMTRIGRISADFFHRGIIRADPQHPRLG